jgi:hypothetical protein
LTQVWFVKEQVQEDEFWEEDEFVAQALQVPEALKYPAWHWQVF